jgi:hypothetical protein
VGCPLSKGMCSPPVLDPLLLQFSWVVCIPSFECCSSGKLVTHFAIVLAYTIDLHFIWSDQTWNDSMHASDETLTSR